MSKPTLERSRLKYSACPLCPKHVRAGSSLALSHGQYGVGFSDQGDPVVTHTLPACPRYVALHADEFLVEVRLARKAAAS